MMMMIMIVNFTYNLSLSDGRSMDWLKELTL